MRSGLAALLVVPALMLAACGGNKAVDTASYTCADFNKSLRTKGDDTAGTFINQLRKQAKLGQSEKVERSEISFGIIVSCRGKPASTKPADGAVAVAKQIKAGKYKPSAKKKSSK
ncbi:MAG TPA: hypothetical protein VF066_03075 [Thermoleophilaceae bacterium]